MKNIFLGVIDRNKRIFIPWRDPIVIIDHKYEVGQNLLVTLEDGQATKIELPTLAQLKAMNDELTDDWARFSELFKQFSMGQKVEMLRALDRKIEEFNENRRY